MYLKKVSNRKIAKKAPISLLFHHFCLNSSPKYVSIAYSAVQIFSLVDYSHILYSLHIQKLQNIHNCILTMYLCTGWDGDQHYWRNRSVYSCKLKLKPLLQTAQNNIKKGRNGRKCFLNFWGGSN